MVARTWDGDVRSAIRRASADGRFTSGGVYALRNRALIGENGREDEKKGGN
jgi:hypothetical protein